MRTRIMTAAAVLAAAVALPAAAQPARRPMTLVDLLNVPQLSDPQISPDGTRILYVLAEADWKANKRIPHVWRVNADGSGSVQLTVGEEGETAPSWSPDGRTIAFLTTRGNDEHAQIYLLPGEGGEARALTRHATAVSSVSWAPDGRTLYFLAADPKSEADKAKAKANDDVFAFDESYEQRHLWAVAVADGHEQQITRGDFSVLAYALSRDGQRLAVHRAPTPLLTDGDASEVWVMDVSGGNATRLTSNDIAENGASLSPDNSRVAFLAGGNAAFEKYYNRNVFVVPAAGGAARLLDVEPEVERAAWSSDGKSVYFVGNMGVHSQLFRLDLDSGKATQLTSGDHNVKAWTMSRSGDRHVMLIETPDSPGEVWVMPTSSGATPAKVTRVFDYLARDFDLPAQKRVTWKGADGVPVEGLVIYPLGYVAGQRYPLCVQTHGGPQASDKFGFGYWGNYVQVLAAKGYVVLQPNYRGSTGYGDAFLRDMVGHYFQNAHLDVMAGVDHLIASGVADPDRMVKMGWSGGGHMTNWIITFTDRFKAAASGAGASNWVSMYAQSDTRSYRTPWFGGTPWQKDAPIEVYWEHSPLKHVASVKTPTIFLVGANDERVPPPQSVEIYRALVSLGVPTHLYMAPREPHSWRELRHQLFKMNVELDWFERWATRRLYTWENAPESSGDQKDAAAQAK